MRAPPEAALAGDPAAPPILDRLVELDRWLELWVARVGWTARELCTLPKGAVFSGRRAVAIPPEVLWQRMPPTLHLYAKIRAEVGAPLKIRGYRPPDYNAAVGGSSGSQHQWFAALDIYGPMESLVPAAVRLYRAHGTMGLGVYAGNIHIDTGHRKRHWGSGAAAALR